MDTQQQCRGYAAGGIAPHDAPSSAFSTGKTRCKTCTARYFADWAASKRSALATKRPATQAAQAPSATALPSPNVKAAIVAETTPAPVQAIAPSATQAAHPLTHQYRLDPTLEALWRNLVRAADDGGDPMVLALHGPQGCGKTAGARRLAEIADRPFYKIDAKSMTDPESWFGTRGASNGSTFYAPSEFVRAIQTRSVVFVDEYTRTTNEVRDVLNPLTDGTRRVLNPITGEVVQVHPECLFIFAGNVGYQFSGTFDVDPATVDRLVVHNMTYPDRNTECAILQEHCKIDAATALRLVRLGEESRRNPNLPTVSTRSLLQAGSLIHYGTDPTVAVWAAVIAGADDTGGDQSPRARLDVLWSGLANTTEGNTTESEGTK